MEDEQTVVETEFMVHWSVVVIRGWYKDGIKLFNFLLREVEGTSKLS